MILPLVGFPGLGFPGLGLPLLDAPPLIGPPSWAHSYVTTGTTTPIRLNLKKRSKSFIIETISSLNLVNSHHSHLGLVSLTD